MHTKNLLIDLVISKTFLVLKHSKIILEDSVVQLKNCASFLALPRATPGGMPAQGASAVPDRLIALWNKPVEKKKSYEQ